MVIGYNHSNMKDIYRQAKVEINEVYLKTKDFILDVPEDLKSMENRFKNIHWGYKAGAIALEVVTITSCFGGKTIEPTQKLNTDNNSGSNTSETNPNKSKTGEELSKAAIESFTTSHPEYKDREGMFAINVVFGGESIDTIVIPSNEKEAVEVNSYKYQYEGQELQSYDKAIVYTTHIKFDGTTEYVRLAGVRISTEDDSVNTVWYYSPDAFDKTKSKIDFTQKVFGFNSNDTNMVYWPLLDEPYKIQWSENLGSTNPEDFTPWNGIDPFTISMGGLQNTATGKALFAPKPIDVEPPLPEGLNDFAEELETKNYTLGYSKVEGNKKNVVMFYVDPETQAKTEVSEIVINPDGSGTRTYMCVNPEGEPEQIVADYTKEQLLEGNFSAWKLVEGKLVRKNVIHVDPKTGVETELDEVMYSDKEKILLVLAATNAIKEANGGNIPDEYGKLGTDHMYSLIPNYNNGTAKFKELVFKVFLGKNVNGLKGYNRVYIKNTKGEYDIDTYQYTTYYAYSSLNTNGNIALLAIHTLTGKHEYIIDEAQLSDHSIKVPNPFRID